MYLKYHHIKFEQLPEDQTLSEVCPRLTGEGRRKQKAICMAFCFSAGPALTLSMPISCAIVFAVSCQAWAVWPPGNSPKGSHVCAYAQASW